MSEKEKINIRSKPTRISESTNDDYDAHTDELIENDLRAAAVQMESIEPIKFNVKESPIRTPAPLPEAISPAGIPIDLDSNSPEMKEIRSETESPKSVRGEFKINLAGIDEEVDLTVEGGKNQHKTYKRSVKGSLMVIALLLTSVHLFLNHLTMFSWVVNFDSPEMIIAALFYFISTLCIFLVLLAALVVPGMSLKEEKFKVYYSPIVVAGVIDFIAVLMAGGIFSPLNIYTYSSDFQFYNQMALLLTVLINGGLYYGFTRIPADGVIYSYFHPFERVLQSEDEKEIAQIQEV